MWVVCDPGAPPVGGKTGPVPYDTTGGDEGFVGTRTSGFRLRRHRSTSRAGSTAAVRPARSSSIRRRSTNATAIYGDDGVAEIVPLDDRRHRDRPARDVPRPRDFYKVPSQYNEHQNTRGSERQASGSIVGRLVDRHRVRLGLHEQGQLVRRTRTTDPLSSQQDDPGAHAPGSSYVDPKRKRVMSAGNDDQAKALTGVSCHNPPSAQ